jgi:TRAP-type transport system periplasmic protein
MMTMKWRYTVVATLVGFLLFTAAGMTSIAAAAEYNKTLKLASPMPAQSFAGQMHQWWAKQLEERTKGRVKIQFFWMESLVQWKDMLPGVASGIADIGYVAATYHPSDLPLYMLVDMPGNAVDYWAGSRAVTDACNLQPDLVAELKRNNIVQVGPWNSGEFHIGTKKKWNSLSELKGMTMRSYGGALIDYHKLLGLNPVFMSYSEIYEAMQRGAVDGSATTVLQLSDALKHYEVMAQVTNLKAGFVVGGSGLALNRKVYDQMPKDIQEILLKLNYDLGTYWAEQLYTEEAKIKTAWRDKHGVIVNELSPEDMKLSADATKKAQDMFIAKLESQKLPARKVWDYFRGQVVKYENEVKEKGYPWKRK